MEMPNSPNVTRKILSGKEFLHYITGYKNVLEETEKIDLGISFDGRF